jgi:hypothetical protein
VVAPGHVRLIRDGENLRRGISTKMQRRGEHDSRIIRQLKILQQNHRVPLPPVDRHKVVRVAADRGFEMWAFLHYADTMRLD